MTSRESPSDRIAREAGERVTGLVAEVRRHRIGAGMSQATLGGHAGVSRDRISRIERGKEPEVPAALLIKLAAWVGLSLPMRLFPGIEPIHDAGQVRVLGRLVARFGDGWGWRYEVPFPIPADQRAWDAVGTHAQTGLVLHVEAETRLGDVQALLRRLALKRRDGRADRLVLVLADTRHDRLVVRAAAAELGAAFPAERRQALRDLIAGRDTGADTLLLI